MVAVALLMASQARADFINGGFEAGASPWQATGDAALVGTVLGIAPPGGTTQGLISTFGAADGGGLTGVNAVPVAAVETFLSLPAGFLSAAPLNGVEGSAVRQTNLVVNAGDELTFRWNFLSNEPLFGAGAANDFVVAVTISQAVGPPSFAFLIEDVIGTPFFPTTSPAFFQTGYQTFAFRFAASGTYTVGVAILDAQFTDGPSILLADNFVLAAVPEPASLSLATLGVFGLLGYRWRRGSRSVA